MDQDAFRNMLSAPRSDAGPSRHQKGNFGGAGPKRGWGIKQTKEYKTTLPHEAEPKKEAHIAPRHVQKKQPGETKYKDRAEMRRAGKDDEYKDVETMLADFEKRKAEAEDAETVEKTRQFLGGDAAHSVMVKGLDYALLAQRKAELQREQEVDRDDELDAMMDDIGSKPGRSVQNKKEKKEDTGEKLGKGFKSIGQRKEDATVTGEKKKKKKKKVVKQEDTKAEIKMDQPSDKRRTNIVEEAPSKTAARPPPAMPAPADEPEEDIFGDAGEYDMGGGAVSDDDSESEGEAVDRKPVRRDDRQSEPERGRSRSREDQRRRYNSASRSRSDSRRRYDSPSPDRHRRRSPPRHTYRDRSDSRDRRRPRYRSRSRTPPRHRYRSPSRSPPRRYRSRSRSPRRRAYSPARSPRRYRSPSRSRSPYGDKRRRYRSPSRSSPRRPRRSPSPYSRNERYRSPSRSPRPPRTRSASRDRNVTKQKGPLQQSRSPSPFMFAGPPMSRSPSGSRSPSPVAQGGRLQPLQSSAITDLSGFLAADSASAKADEKRLKKAQWRARQGLGIQEGVDPSALKKEMNDKQKSNREYMLLMNKLKKDEAGGAGEGSKDTDKD